MDIIIGIISVLIFLFVLHALSMSTEGVSLWESIINFIKEIYYFFKNKEWKD